MENIAKISFLISFAAFAAAGATLASVNGAALNSAVVESPLTTMEESQRSPIAGASHRAAPVMLLPNALDKAAADEIEHRAADVSARKAALAAMQRGVIRLR